MLSYYGVTLTTDQLATKIGSLGLVTFDQTLNALAYFGYKIRGTTDRTLVELKSFIDDDTPFLALVHYGDLPGRQDTYVGGHAVVVVGYDDKYVYVNDPDFWGNRRNEGASKAYPITAFNKAWQSGADGNAGGNLWYLELPKPTTVADLQKDLEDMRDSRNKWKTKCADEEAEHIKEIRSKVDHIEELQTSIADLNTALTQLRESQETLNRDLQASRDEATVLKGSLEATVKENERLLQRLQAIQQPAGINWLTKLIEFFKGGVKK
jgi:outer membrane murein-binding lipoprotein Lpp